LRSLKAKSAYIPFVYENMGGNAELAFVPFWGSRAFLLYIFKIISMNGFKEES
jgi:hypothetical protein